MTLRFTVKYPEEYPEVLPEMDLEPVEGEWENDEYNELMEDLRSVVRLPLVALHSCASLAELAWAGTDGLQGEESIGMAMVFTLASHLRESTSALVAKRVVDKQRAEDEAHQKEEEVRLPPHIPLCQRNSER